MEVRVEAENGLLPDMSYIAVRIGEVQKQTLYDPKKVYKFPEARRFGKIDVYQRMGTCDLVWGTDQPEVRVCKVVSSEGDTGARLKVHISQPSTTGRSDVADPQTNSPARALPAGAKGKETSAAAKRYLQDHDVEGILTGAMRALLKSTPEDAPGFLCNYITSRYAAKQDKPASASPTHPLTQLPLSARPVHVAPDFRTYYGRFVLPPRWHSFLPAFHERCAWPRAERKPQIASVLQPKVEFKYKPSVASWTNPSLNSTLRRRLAPLQPNVEYLRSSAREVMIQASLDGRLNEALKQNLPDQALTDARTPPLDMEEFRRQAREVVIKAQKEGVLEEALTQALTSRSDKPLCTHASETERLREKACDTLMRAVEDGSLMQALSDSLAVNKTGQNQAPLDMEALREQARAILIAGNSNGSLATVLQQARAGDKGTPDVSQLRAQVCDILVSASQDGTLARALTSNVKQEDKEVIWQLAYSSLADGVKNGSLATALESVGGNRRQDPDVDRLRMQVCELLVKASQDNRLTDVLKNARKQPPREEAQADLTNLRKLAYNTLLKAVEEDSLTPALKQVRPGAMSIDQLRQQACQILTKASEDNTLTFALESAKMEQLPTWGDIQVLRKQACSALVRSTQNGSLTRVVKSVARDAEAGSRVSTQEQANPANTHDLRMRVCDLFGQAYLDGSLERALKDMGDKPKDIVKLRASARAALQRSAEDGSLRSALSTVASRSAPKDIDALRRQACDVFSKAVVDGSLQSALTPKVQARDVLDLRKRACDVFLNACVDGSLQKALLEVARDKTSVKNASRLPGAAEQVEISWKSSPSVGTWLHRKRPKPPSRNLAELRVQAREVFISACQSGALSSILSSIPAS